MAELPPSIDSTNPWSQADKELVDKPLLLESKKFWGWAIFTIFILLLGGGALYYFTRPAPPPQAVINFAKPEELKVGQTFELGVTITNNSAVPLEGGKLSLTLLDGLVFGDDSQSEKYMEIDTGAIAPGAIHDETFHLLPTGDAENNIRHVSAVYQYHGTTNDKVQFEKKNDIDLTVSQTIAGLTIEVPQKILSGEAFSLRFVCRNNTKLELSTLKLKVNYPPAFEFATSSLPTTSQDNNEWQIPPLPAGATQEVSIEGQVKGTSSSFYGFSGELSQSLGNQSRLIQKQSANTTIRDTPLALAILANNSPEYIARPGDSVAYVLTYRNNSEVTLSDVVLTASLGGEFFNFSKAESKATFDSVQNTFTWNKQNTPGLANLAPAAEGRVGITIPLRLDYPSPRPPVGGNLLKVSARIESPTVPPKTAASSTVGVATLQTKVKGALVLKTQGFWRDAAAKILNSGPYPIKVNTPTQFTIHWLAQATGSDFDNIQLSAPLLAGVTWTGTVKSSTPVLPEFNSANNKITWNVDKLPAGNKAEGIFQLEVTPAVNQVGHSIPLIGETKLTTTDTFTGKNLSGTNLGVDTSIPDDSTIKGVRWVVP